MSEADDIFEQTHVLQTGHFKLSSGRHSRVYLQCQRALEHPKTTRTLGEALAERFVEGADVVLSPAVGAILIGNAVAEALGARFVFAERQDGKLTLRRGQAIAPGERVIVVEDVITTGGSAAECVSLAKSASAKVIGVGSLVDRSPSAPAFRLESLLKVDAETYDPANCPACADGVPIHSPGSRSLA
ncbi:MAG: orotate phosphoribosyltransferase [Actinomycetota bacterium]